LSSIPANATITSATLSLWTAVDYSDNNRTIRVYRLKVPFNEMQATWNEAATGVNWQSAGASGANDRESIEIGSVQVLADEAIGIEKQISLSPAKIQEFVSGSFTNNGFILVADTELNDRFNYKSSEASVASYHPKLVVQYTLSSQTPTATPAVTNTPTLTPTTGPSATPTATPPSGPVSVNATFLYDGDGKRVAQTLNGMTTYFVGSYYEKTGSTVTKYYYAGSQRVAMRQGTALYYLLSDHLGSTSLTTDASGNVLSEMRYTAWGEVRYNSGITPTDYTYTGQYSYTSEFGLMFYNARWYDPALGRFAQADTVIPGAGNPQDWDRYAYALNDPIRYNDPSGHGVDCGIGAGCVKDYSRAKTLKDFQDLGWKERMRWLDDFAHERDLKTWFDDMKGAIDLMSSDQRLSQEGGITEVMDAAVLQAINDGWLLAHDQSAVGGGGQGWEKFFRSLDSSDLNTQISLRIKAEQLGVDYAWALSGTQAALNSSSKSDQIYFGTFKWGADGYRNNAIWFRSDPLRVTATELTISGPFILEVTDPNTSGPYLNFIGKVVLGGMEMLLP